MDKIEIAKEKFGEIVKRQLERAKRMKDSEGFVDFSSIPKIVIGVIDGDGIGPIITREAARVLEFILKDEIARGKVEIRQIVGLSIEARVRAVKPLPEAPLAEIKACHVLLKGPMATPDASGGGPNIESANVAMRKELDLFANVRPVKVPEKGIDWTFFRENTEGGYAIGSEGIEVDDDLLIDFTVVTDEGCRRVIRTAFDYAKNNGKKRVTAVTKANVIKKTDGRFLNVFYEISKEYPDIKADDWYVDIMSAKLIDEKRRGSFEVFVMPNLYGDILTDEAAEIQGGVGTAGSSNIGKRYAMFEAIHGSAPRMVEEGRAQYADPRSIIKAAAMLLSHIGYTEYAFRLERALEICDEEGKARITGKPDGATCHEFGDYVMETLS